jgi:hypothetical protein
MTLASILRWGASALFAATLPAQAAFLIIDDSDPDTITVTAGDFESGFSVNGTLLTIGLSDNGSATFNDGTVLGFEGSWIDLGLSDADYDINFGIGNVIFSGVEAGGSTDGFLGTITGEFAGFDPSTNYGVGAGVLPQDGSTVDFSFPFLGARFVSEARVPEPTTLAALGVGLALIGFSRRRSRS